jgi:hypothetical protein
MENIRCTFDSSSAIGGTGCGRPGPDAIGASASALRRVRLNGQRRSGHGRPGAPTGTTTRNTALTYLP